MKKATPKWKTIDGTNNDRIPKTSIEIARDENEHSTLIRIRASSYEPAIDWAGRGDETTLASAVRFAQLPGEVAIDAAWTLGLDMGDFAARAFPEHTACRQLAELID